MNCGGAFPHSLMSTPEINNPSWYRGGYSSKSDGHPAFFDQGFNDSGFPVF